MLVDVVLGPPLEIVEKSSFLHVNLGIERSLQESLRCFKLFGLTWIEKINFFQLLDHLVRRTQVMVVMRLILAFSISMLA